MPRTDEPIEIAKPSARFVAWFLDTVLVVVMIMAVTAIIHISDPRILDLCSQPADVDCEGIVIDPPVVHVFILGVVLLGPIIRAVYEAMCLFFVSCMFFPVVYALITWDKDH